MKGIFVSSFFLFTCVLFTSCRPLQPGLSWTSAESNPSKEEPQHREIAAPPQALPLLRQIDRSQRDEMNGLPSVLSLENKQPEISMRFRRVIPSNVEPFVRRSINGLDLTIADETPDGWFGFYKGRCGSLGDVCQYVGVLYRDDGSSAWEIDLTRFLQSSRYVEIQDIRYHEGALYFNEACTSYSSELGGACSWLLKIDPVWRELDWRTESLTSNNIFILDGDYVVAGYGFTGESSYLHLVNKRSGIIAASVPLDSSHEYLEVVDPYLYVITHTSVYTLSLSSSP